MFLWHGPRVTAKAHGVSFGFGTYLSPSSCLCAAFLLWQGTYWSRCTVAPGTGDVVPYRPEAKLRHRHISPLLAIFGARSWALVSFSSS